MWREEGEEVLDVGCGRSAKVWVNVGRKVGCGLKFEWPERVWLSEIS